MAAVDRHKKDPDTRAAQQKSGMWGPSHERQGRSGLSAEELSVRRQRDAAKRDIVVAHALRRETADRASWDRCWHYTSKPIGQASQHLQWWSHRQWPRSFKEMKGWEQRLLERLESDALKETHKDAVAQHGGACSAKRFRVASSSTGATEHCSMSSMD